MKTLSISRLGAIYIFAALVAGSLLVGTALVVLEDARVVGTIWHAFEATRSEKARALGALRREMGYGGMIHHFKNFVLRGDTHRRILVEQKIGGARAAIDHYRTLGPNPAEEQALADIETVIRRYLDGLEVAAVMLDEGADVILIDRAVAVNDRPALDALAALNRIANVKALRDRGASKPVLLYDLRAALGYGGMIHQFKNYVLRRDPPRVENVQSRIADIRRILASYRTLPLEAEEEDALAAIGAVAADYEANLAEAVALAEKGALPRAIDTAVKVDDRPASG